MVGSVINEKQTYAQVLKKAVKMEKSNDVKERGQKRAHRTPLILNTRQDQIPSIVKALSKVAFNDKLVFLREIGNGGYGTVFLALHKETKEQLAIKQATGAEAIEMLYRENRIYEKLKNTDGFAKVYDYAENSQTALMLMEYLGKSLYNIVCAQGKLSLAKTANVGLQMLTILKNLHSHGIIHRDISPSNIVTLRHSQFDTDKVLLIDFGLAEEIIPDLNGGYYVNERHLRGNSFTSLRSDKCLAVSYRDDLESLGFVLLYLARGSFPWNVDLVEKHGTAYYLLAKELRQLKPILRKSHDLFVNYFEYVRSMKLGQLPDYTYLSSLLHKMGEPEQAAIPFQRTKHDAHGFYETLV